MDDRVARLETAVTLLTQHVRDLEFRLAGLEGARSGAPGDIPRAVAPPAADFDSAPVQQWLALAGRTLVVLGGAYLLRALTDSRVFAAPVGVALGLAYGAPWLVLASRAGSRGAQLDALCHALATALIGYPLVWEATVRFGVLAPAQSAALLGALTGAALLLSAITRLHSLAWIVTFGALGSAAGLAAATRDWNSYTLLAIGVGLATLWLGYVRAWGGVRWLAAAGANVLLLFATARAVVTGAPEGALALQFLMFAGYIGSFAVRSVARAHRLRAFEPAQAFAVLAICLGGSIFLLKTGGGRFAVGASALALGVSAYSITWRFVRQRRDLGTYFFWSFFALALTSMGVWVCFGATAASLIYAVAACVAASRRGPQADLVAVPLLQAAVYALLTALGSGLLDFASLALVRPPALWWPAPDAAALVAFAALAAVVVIQRRPTAEPWITVARVPRLVLVIALVWTSMGLAVWFAATRLADPRTLDPSMLATVRTGILIAATLALARVARYEGGREAGWLMFPLLVITGMKLVFFDFAIGRPQTLFAAMALYGFALIAAPRVWRTERRELRTGAHFLHQLSGSKSRGW